LGDNRDRPQDFTFRADVAATESAMGWTAGVDLNEGLRRTAEWYRDERRPVEAARDADRCERV